MLVLADVPVQVAQEVDGAALRGRAEDLRQGALQPGVRVADGELDADEPARDQRSKELAPERLGLGFADVDDLPAAGLMDGMGDDDTLAHDTAAVAAFLDFRVDEQVGVTALQRPLSERLDLLIEQAGDPADLALGDPQPETLDELIDAPRRDAADTRLLDDRDERLLRALARCKNDGK